MKTFLSVLLVSLNCEAAVYKWVDNSGTVHYAGIKPFDFKALELPTASYKGKFVLDSSSLRAKIPTTRQPSRNATFVENMVSKRNSCERYETQKSHLQQLLMLPHSSNKGAKLRQQKKQYSKLLSDCRKMH